MLSSSLIEVRVLINQWLEEYDTVRAHGRLGGLNPEEFLQQWIGVNSIPQPESLPG